MAIDEVPVQGPPMQPNTSSSNSFKLVWVLLIAAVLTVGEIYTISRMNTLRDQLTAQQAQLREEMTGQFRNQVSSRLSAIERQNAQDLDAVKAELDKAAKRMGSQGGQLKRASTMVSQLQEQQRVQTEQLKEEIARKADQQQVGALTEDVSSTKTDLNSTKKAVNTLVTDLGMARSNMGTLIARNHDDIEYLRKLGERDYFEFVLNKNQQTKLAGVGLTLKKANVKRHRFNVATLADDIEVERKDCTINSPVFFYVSGSKKPYELVVNRVESNQVKGYLSTPKGVNEVAARSEGTR